MTGEPKISIVTVCYNHEKYIAETIESVLSQKNDHVEYIIIDDGSTDGSWEIMKRYEPHLTYLERLDGYREFPTKTLNYAFSKTTGDILGWINSKNILLPHCLDTVQEIFSTFDEIRWLTGLATTINEQSHVVGVRSFHKHLYDFAIGNWSVIQQESTFWRRSIWELAGPLKESDGWAFDQGLWASFFQREQLYHAQTIFGAYRATPTAVSVRKKEEYLAATDRVIRGLQQSLSKTQRRLARWYRLCFHARWLLRNLPHQLFSRIPKFNQFCHLLVKYDTMNQQWRIEKKNPFRTYN